MHDLAVGTRPLLGRSYERASAGVYPGVAVARNNRMPRPASETVYGGELQLFGNFGSRRRHHGRRGNDRRPEGLRDQLPHLGLLPKKSGGPMRARGTVNPFNAKHGGRVWWECEFAPISEHANANCVREMRNPARLDEIVIAFRHSMSVMEQLL
jgi:hypothetical protein